MVCGFGLYGSDYLYKFSTEKNFFFGGGSEKNFLSSLKSWLKSDRGGGGGKIFFKKKFFFKFYFPPICVVRRIKWFADSDSTCPITYIRFQRIKKFFLGGVGKKFSLKPKILAKIGWGGVGTKFFTKIIFF